MDLHIDLSVKYNRRGDSIIGYVDKLDPIIQHAVFLKDSMKKELNKKYNLPSIYHELHAVMIFLLTKDLNLHHIEKIIICNDYNHKKVLASLEILYNNKEYLRKIISLTKYRYEIKDNSFKSYADKFVKKVKKHLHKRKNIRRRHPIMNFCKPVQNQELQVCLKFLLNEKLKDKEQIVYTALQQSLNISQSFQDL